jgi:hypothetical protein
MYLRMKKLIILMSLLVSVNAFAGFANVKATGEIESKIPATSILKKFSITYTDPTVGPVTATLILVESTTSAKRALLSLTSSAHSYIYELSANADSILKIAISPRYLVLEIDIKEGTKVVPINIMPLVDSTYGASKLLDSISIYDELGYSR